MKNSLSSGFKRQFANIIWLVGGRLIKAPITFIVGVFVARYLGPDRFGVLNYAIGLSMLFGIFSAVGMDGVLVRELVRLRNDKNTLLGSACLLRIIGGVISFLMTMSMLMATHADHETWILTLICATSFFFMPTEVLRGFNEAEVKGKTIVLVEAIQCLLTSLLQIYFIVVEGSVFGFALCFLLERVFLGFGFVVFYRMYDGHFSDWRIDRATLKQLFKDSMPVLISGVAIVVYQQIDKVMLRNMLETEGNEQVGLYSVALRILPFVLIIPQMIGKALFPAIVEAHSTTTEKYTVRIQLYNDLMTWIGISLALCLCLLASPLISLYGKEYSASIPILRVVAFKGIFVSMSLASGSWILVNNLQKWSVVRNLGGCFANVILNYLWIPRWQALGSAWATIVSFSIAAFFVHAFIPAYRPVFMIQVRSLVGGVFRLFRYSVKFLRFKTGR